jgi:hypothetical protein
MTNRRARTWLVVSSLAICGSALLFFLIAPATSYPLDWPQSMRMLEIVTPVFFGYLGLASRYIFTRSHDVDLPDNEANLLSLLLIGPLVLFVLVMCALILAFGISNSGQEGHADSSRAMSVDQFAAGVTLVLSLLAVTTNVIADHLFGVKSTRRRPTAAT